MNNRFTFLVKKMIETKRLILRKFEEKDSLDLLEYLSKPTVHCFMDMKINTLEEARKEAIKRAHEEDYFAICLKENGKVIGEIFGHEEGEAETYSPCWMLNEKYQGKGYAYEAAKAFFDYVFFQKGARRIFAYCEDDNYPSQHLCERLGMRKEGLYIEFVSFVNDENGQPIYENTYEYAILKKEWIAKFNLP